MPSRLIRITATLSLFATASLSQAEPIQNQYIVVLKDTATLTQILDLPVGTPVKNLLDQA
jgi:Na+-translocating ferredoxin:NAD+ oxidoreductase RnfC subunit